MATKKKPTPARLNPPRIPRVVFSIVESTTRRGRMSFRLNPSDATAHGLFDVIERSGFRPGDRVLMVLAPEPSAGKTIDELIAASSLGTPGAVALRKRGIERHGVHPKVAPGERCPRCDELYAEQFKYGGQTGKRATKLDRELEAMEARALLKDSSGPRSPVSMPRQHAEPVGPAQPPEGGTGRPCIDEPPRKGPQDLSKIHASKAPATEVGHESQSAIPAVKNGEGVAGEPGSVRAAAPAPKLVP